MQKAKSIIPGLVACLIFGGASADESPTTSVDVARFDGEGRLMVPTDMDEWIFLGSSLGMGYSQQSFDPGSPGNFQIVRIEPKAYKAFLETGHFVDGTMIALHFFDSQNRISINRAGFVMGDLQSAEIHYVDSRRFPEGFNFYMVANGQSVAEEVPLPNKCVECHQRDGAYEGAFVQFYPVIRRYLPAAVQAKIEEMGAKHGH